MAVLVGVAACSSPSSGGTSAASNLAACQHSAPAHLPAPAASPPPGGVRWATLLARCVNDAGQQWPDRTEPAAVWADAVPGDRLAVYLNDTVRMYSDTGVKLWQTTVTPTVRGARFTNLVVSSSLVLVEFTAPGTSALAPVLSTFLDASSGRLLGKPNVTLAATPFIVGAHVLVPATETTLEGYDPSTGRTLWTTTVPDAPAAAAEVDDGTTVYLNSSSASGGVTPAMSRIDRLDAATGQLLAPITLPQPLDFDLAVSGGNDYAQGLLVMALSAPCGSPGCPVDQTVAVQTTTGQLAWTYPGQVAVSPGGLFSEAGTGTGNLTAVDPATGRDVWTTAVPGLGADGGPTPTVNRPAYLAELNEIADGSWAVVGISPSTSKQTWTSPKFGTPAFVTQSADTTYALSCTPWRTGESLCANLSLLAIAD